MDELSFLIKKVKAKLKAENVRFSDCKACIMVLSKTVAPNICIKIYNEHINKGRYKMKLTRDINGNKTLNIGKFSIQTNGNLPKVHMMSKEDLKLSENQGIALTEARAYIVKYGTKRQKILLGV